MADHEMERRAPRAPRNIDYRPSQQESSNMAWKVAGFILFCSAVTGLLCQQQGQMAELIEQNRKFVATIQRMETEHANHVKNLERELQKQRKAYAATMKQMSEMENKFEDLLNEERERKAELIQQDKAFVVMMREMQAEHAKHVKNLERELQKQMKADTATMKQMRENGDLLYEERETNMGLTKQNEKLTENLEVMKEQYATLKERIDKLQQEKCAIQWECNRQKESQGWGFWDYAKIGVAGLIGSQFGGLAVGGKVAVSLASEIGSKTLGLIV